MEVAYCSEIERQREYWEEVKLEGKERLFCHGGFFYDCEH